MTSYHTTQDDIRNPGGNWKDEEVMRSENRVFCRKADDIRAFNREMISLFYASRVKSNME
jgi:protease I